MTSSGSSSYDSSNMNDNPPAMVSSRRMSSMFPEVDVLMDQQMSIADPADRSSLDAGLPGLIQ